ARQVRQCERLIELDERLPGILQNKIKPPSPAEGIELTQLCALKRWHGAAASFYEEAFAAQPGLLPAYRYNAACAAAQAGCGRSKDASTRDDQQRERLRGQALRWLREELEQRARQPGSPRRQLEQMLRHWQRDPNLIGVRDSDALA